ncbi:MULTISPECIES: hypothetical protein [Variovorax]|jgi:hypothetical protein|uniref:hypothetical protein n=1 Tax=Variovorax TaxID=34072 RepID=UPI00089C6A4F|nr:MULTISPECIES: hypothetical protein [Variovorax]UVH59037.1 hypothetical protein NWF24_06410 [Variovorax paradoxus]SDY99357.1 hypothetical protein SAMN05518669_1196 [Variovorax sp. YR634]SEU13898.1 hypothetical protein SAMN05443580_117114 [Variovorax sp. OV084]SOD25649.1 hypothetical protein SAMN05518800_2016 [Variovorax sp. YR752]
MNVVLRILFIAGGALLLGFLSNVILVGIGHWYEMKVARSEYDLSDAFMIAVFVQALCVVAGGLIGNWLYRRWRNKKVPKTD